MKYIGKVFIFIRKFWRRFIWSNIQRKMLGSYGRKVVIMEKCDINYSNVFIGNDVYIGPSARIISPTAKVIINDHVMIGPEVIIITENHKIDEIGMYMTDVAKVSTNNFSSDVIIESDVWIGARVTILPGVKIGKGSVIGAGAVVSKNVPKYSIVTGVKEYNVREKIPMNLQSEHEIKLVESAKIKRKIK